MATTKLKEAKSIFVANVKGGVGKSTLSIMLARALAEKNTSSKYYRNRYRPSKNSNRIFNK